MSHRNALLGEVQDAIADLPSMKAAGKEALPGGVSPEHVAGCTEHFGQIEGYILSGKLPAAEGRTPKFDRIYTGLFALGLAARQKADCG